MIFRFNYKMTLLLLKYDILFYCWYVPIDMIKDALQYCKWWYQRRTRGFDDRDWETLDVSFAQFVLPRLIHFRNNTQSCPSSLQLSEWHSVLDEMIYAFELMSEYDVFTTDKQEESINKGLSLFSDYAMELWEK